MSFLTNVTVCAISRMLMSPTTPLEEYLHKCPQSRKICTHKKTGFVCIRTVEADSDPRRESSARESSSCSELPTSQGTRGWTSRTEGMNWPVRHTEATVTRVDLRCFIHQQDGPIVQHTIANSKSNTHLSLFFVWI